MSSQHSLAEVLHRALKFLQVYGPEDPKAAVVLKGVKQILDEHIVFTEKLEIDASLGRYRLLLNGQPMDGPPASVKALAQALTERRLIRLTFGRGLQTDELKLLFFILQLRPQRLSELGGAITFQTELGAIRVEEGTPEAPTVKLPTGPVPVLMEPPAEVSATPAPRPPKSTQPLGDLARLLEAPSQPIKVRIAAPVPDETVYLPPPPSSLSAPPPTPYAPPPAPASRQFDPPDIPRTMPAEIPVEVVDSLDFSIIRPADPGLPEPLAAPPLATAPPPETDLAGPLHERLDAIQQAAKPGLPAGFSYPFASEHLEVLRRAGLAFADLTPIAGIGEQLGLARVDPVTLREALRQAFARLPRGGQGTLLLGLPTFPAGEPGLRRAFDYLAPELLAQTVAEVLGRDRMNATQVAYLAAILLLCVKDRDLSVEALKGRLQFEGWSTPQLEELHGAILWESQGTDTKLRSALDEKRDLMDMDPTQVMGLTRQTLRRGDLDGLGRILDSLETAIRAKDLPRRVRAAEILEDLVDCAEDPGIPGAQLVRIHQLVHNHLRDERSQEALLWSCQTMEALLGHRIRHGDFSGAYREVQSLLDLGAAHLSSPDLDWKVNAFQDLVTRLAGPLNMADLAPLLHDDRFAAALPQLYSLLAVMGLPAARYLVVCLGLEEDRERRRQLMAAIKAIGRKASLPLRESLRAQEWYLVRNAVDLLGEIQDGSAFDEVAACLAHADPRVRSAVLAALRAMDPSRAAKALGEALAGADGMLQLELVAALGDLGQDRAVPDLLGLFRASKPGPEGERLRLRIFETLAALRHPDAIPALQSVFKKKGPLTRPEPVAIRPTAPKALAAIGTRESKEAMAMGLEIESAEEVRAILRQFLVGGA